MWRIALPLEETSLELTPRWGQFGQPWTTVLLALFFVVPLLLILLLSRYEMRLVRTVFTIPLLGLRLLVLAALWFVVGFQPTVARYHHEEIPSQVIVAVDLSRSMDVVDPGRSLTRKDLARKILLGDGMLRRLSEKHTVKLYGFHRRLVEGNLERPEELFALNDKAGTEGLATNLSLPLVRGNEKSGELLGMILLTDGQHNHGPLPSEKVKDFGKPLHIVALGTKDPPPDLAVVEMKAPDNAFRDTEVQVEARIKSSGMAGQDAFVELLQNGKLASPEHKKTLKPGEQWVRFQVKLEDLGTHPIEVKVSAASKQPAEVTLENNSMTRAVRVLQDKTKVLVVDDEARWEYHYLANALLRDKTAKGEPSLQVERVLFRQPRLGIMSEADLEKSNNPKTKLPPLPADGKGDDPLFRFDVILLGDVGTRQLPLADRQRLERYVSHRGGTLVLQAGKRSWPGEFLKLPGPVDPLVKMLPIAEPRTLVPKNGFFLGLTPDGQDRTFLQMEQDPAKNQAFWTDMPRHFWGTVGKPKPGATVLAYATEVDVKLRGMLDKDQGLIVLMPYGFGQVMHMGIDSTWRWRYRIGDDYHHHFWGQLVRWAAADRLLPAGNRFVRYGTRAPVYRQGKEIDIGARFSEDAGPLPESAKPAARIVRIRPGHKEEKSALVPLVKKEHQASVLQGQLRDLPPGQYRIELDIPELQSKINAVDPKDPAPPGSDTFTVLPDEEGEMFDLAANWPLMTDLAQKTRGEVYTPETAADIIDRLARQITVHDTFEHEHVWQDAPMVWWMLGLLLTLLSLEWTLRKLAGLS